MVSKRKNVGDRLRINLKRLIYKITKFGLCRGSAGFAVLEKLLEDIDQLLVVVADFLFKDPQPVFY
jgi:hypothetical protein